jgi:hypothetical protein
MSMSERRDVGLTGWVVFAAIWLIVAGAFNAIEGLTAIHRSNQLAGGTYLFSSISTWGWIILIVGIVQLVAGFMVYSGNPTGFTLGVVVAMVAAFFWFFFLFTVPIGALLAIVMNGLVIYGLTIGVADTA